MNSSSHGPHYVTFRLQINLYYIHYNYTGHTSVIFQDKLRRNINQASMQKPDICTYDTEMQILPGKHE